MVDEIHNENARDAADRGAFSHLQFSRCARGFTLTVIASGDYGRSPPITFAFDKIEAVAAWLVDQYTPSEQLSLFEAAKQKPATKRRSTRARTPRRK